MEKILQFVETPYLSAEYLFDLFKAYDYPKDKIKNLVKKNELINVVRGLYVIGSDYKKPYSKEVLAGLLYGPSAVSFEYALSYHGFIPERVETLTSLCFKRDKAFETPLGLFTYKYISQEKYSVALHYEQTELGHFFMATPEKAICDMAYFQKINTEEEAIDYLLNDLRIYEDKILNLDIGLLMELKKMYGRISVTNIVNAIILIKNENEKSE